MNQTAEHRRHAHDSSQTAMDDTTDRSRRWRTGTAVASAAASAASAPAPSALASPTASADSAAFAAAATSASAATSSGLPSDSTAADASSPPSPASPLTRLPDALILSLANELLADAEANALARSCKMTLHALQRYRFKGRVPVQHAARFSAVSPARFGIVQRVMISGERVPAAELPAMMQSLPATVTELAFPHGWNAPVEQLLMPPALRILDMQASACDQPIARWRLSDTLTELSLPHALDKPIDAMLLPASLLKLSTGGCAHSLAGLKLPQRMQELSLGWGWDRPLSDLPPLPDSLLTLDLGGFDSAISADFRWPQHLTKLRWRAFNRPLQGVKLPDSLTNLSFGALYSHSLNGVQLPASLQTLRFHHDSPFKHSLDAVQWPAGLRSLTLPVRWSQPVAGLRLPDSLTHLELGYRFLKSLRTWHPPASLTDFELNAEWGRGLSASDLRLPSNLVECRIPHGFAVELADLALPAGLQSLTLGGSIRISDPSRVMLPPGLSSLHLGSSRNTSLDGLQWPPQLTHLCTGALNQPLLNLPDSLTHLQLGDLYGGWNLPVSQLQLPPNLQRLEFGAAFDQPLAGLQWPASLVSLAFSNSGSARFNQPLSSADWHPASLRHLSLGVWRRPMTELTLPPQLESLTLAAAFTLDMSSLQLPASLRKLVFEGEGPKSLRGLKLPPALRELSLPYSQIDGILADLPEVVPTSMRLIKVRGRDQCRLRQDWLLRCGVRAVQSGCVVST